MQRRRVFTYMGGGAAVAGGTARRRGLFGAIAGTADGVMRDVIVEADIRPGISPKILSDDIRRGRRGWESIEEV